MLIVFYKTDGEIYRVATGYNNFNEFFGDRAEEMSKVYDSIYIDFNDFIFRNYFSFYISDNKVMPCEKIKHMFTLN